MTTYDRAAKQTQNNSNLMVRVMTALVGGPIVLLVTYLGGIPFLLAGLTLAGLSLLELYAFGARRGVQGRAVIGLPVGIGIVLNMTVGMYNRLPLYFLVAALATVLVEIIYHVGDGRAGYRVAVTLAGLVYTAIPVAFLIEIRSLPDGLLWVLAIYAVTWGTDTLAYFGGRWFGRRPLAPRISPKKTREGALVGLAGGFLAGLLVLAVGGQLSTGVLAVLVIGPPLAVFGDLFESALKRAFEVGDSHLTGLNIVPGHGGILDRTDALVWVTILFYTAFKLGLL
jgi:phosphatidate cytidylyltransferase